ncbi:rRNA maturation RNase YbeY [Nioella nitratireducens]|uniref:rRNA maturation RNase YbeY n=1 Tax=Nioella nitratireducens TaxID=1287720 RepID=UPI0008FD65C4|nr:rRNA maturation RNase YbeY [Nioella nitratireducens]
MTDLVDVICEAPEWEAADLETLAEQACRAALTWLALDPSRFEISLLACDDARIANLNADFRGKPQPTNVLSWPADEIDLPLGAPPEMPDPGPDGPPYELGDIAIAYQTCQREAKDQDKPFADHVRHLLVHGTLHLLGFDHINDADAAVMEGIETRVLATLGVPDPY